MGFRYCRFLIGKERGETGEHFCTRTVLGLGNASPGERGGLWVGLQHSPANSDKGPSTFSQVQCIWVLTPHGVDWILSMKTELDMKSITKISCFGTEFH